MGASKTILLTAWGGTGEVFPVLGIAVALRRRGHRAVLAAPACHAEEAAAAGVAFQPLRPPLPDTPQEAMRLARDMLDPWRGRRRVWRERLLPALRDSLADLQAAAAPDLVLAHPEVPAAPFLAEMRGVPWLTLLLRPAALASPHDPPALPGIAMLRAIHPRLAGRLLPRLSAPEPATTAMLAAFRAELGLPAAPVPAEGALALFPAAFRPPRPDVPAGTVMTGFVPYDGAARRPMPPELLDFLDAGAAPVVFTLGEAGIRLAGDFFALAIAAAEALGRRAVLLVGGAAALGTPPSAGVAVLDYAPHGELLARAAAVVHHGGIGTTAQALRAGKPGVIVPFGGDLHENARLAAAMGAATVLRPARLGPRALARLLARLLADPAAPARLAASAAAVAQDGAEAAADAVEVVLQGRDVTRPLRRPRIVWSA